MIRKKIKNRKGFTLIEIIAVLVILGILAAVAIPKYLDLQDEAEKRAAEGAVAAAQSRLSMVYSMMLLSKSATKPTSAQDVVDEVDANCDVEGDFTVDCDPSGGTVTITAHRTTGDAALTATGKWELPGYEAP